MCLMTRSVESALCHTQRCGMGETPCRLGQKEVVHWLIVRTALKNMLHYISSVYIKDGGWLLLSFDLWTKVDNK